MMLKDKVTQKQFYLHPPKGLIDYFSFDQSRGQWTHNTTLLVRNVS